jgi:hypothetical protein
MPRNHIELHLVVPTPIIRGGPGLRGKGDGCKNEKKAESLLHWDSPQRLNFLANIVA